EHDHKFKLLGDSNKVLLPQEDESNSGATGDNDIVCVLDLVAMDVLKEPGLIQALESVYDL
ncbi:hypothetical protein HDU98_005854, partial [Podochytrium sp. JEL0797]